MKKLVSLVLLHLILSQSYVFAQSSRLTGKVTDQDNVALPGVSILLSGSTTGTVTDADGNFTINAPGNGSLVFSFIGYQSQTVAINNRTTIDLKLVQESTSLGELVVVGYGTQKKTDVTGALSVVSTREFSQQPITRLDQVLQGRAAGVQVTQSNGAPGGDARVRVRGANSVLGNNDPLYVIDGFVGANYNLLNPADIESLQILKDAASTSIYGSRGANGVVIITTKKGTKGLKVNYEGQGSVSNVIKTFDILPAGEFAEIVNARAIATGSNTPFTDAQIANFKQNGGTDWQDLVYRKGGGTQQQITVSGGNEKTSFLVSGNYVKQRGIVENSGFKRYVLRTNLNTQINKKLSMRLNLSGAKSMNHNTDGGGALIEALQWAPTTPAYGEDGQPTFADPIGSVSRSPLDQLYDKSNDIDRMNINAIGGLNWQLPVKGLSLDLQYAINYLNAQNKNFTGKRLSNNNPSASRYSSEQVTLQNTNALNYNTTIGNHSINAVAVLETQQFTDRNFTATATGLRFPQLGYDNIGGNSAATVVSGYSKWTLLSFLGRVNYAFRDKYLVTAAIRRDGSSKFSKDNRNSVFPSVALGWRLSEEEFIKNINVFSNLKLRASWGMTGSQAINPYATLSPYNTTQMAFNNTAVTAGVIQGNQGNKNLKWETTRQTDVGIEMEFLNGRLHVEADYFHKNTTDLLLNVALPNYAGGGTQVRNVGEIENKGFEFAIGGTPVESGKFSWETNLNFSTLKNQVLSLGGLPRLGTGTGAGGGMSITNEFMLKPGEPLGSYWGLNYLGTFKQADADAAAKQGRVPGDPRYEDVNGDNAITTDDFQIVGRAFPKLTGGWNNTFTYSGLTLNVFFQGAFGLDKLNYTRAGAMSGSGEARQFLLTEIRDYYRPGNENSDIPAFTKTYQPFTQSSRFVENGSYVRLKNVSLSYNVPTSIFKDKATIRVFASATNVLTFTKYTGPDPESSNVGSNTDTAMGIDRGSYPNAKVYTIGLNLGF
ncbi:SusC/RagA family TonB-linked outer membrane protein [Dyadobacter psychrophilus]|uniref:TonB-linked outer membrane protein, SusC/RagA family n=1 Tax=Dyadobacter psychrophilus TaxID=651661 RepID=A0A1T5DIW6_9BACT|nr:TonB-dependent receptor [Dyadobacter psychrophilus]SKB71664.1 TonB-linked outer membrane protein, SusC/RagA family [Dyadobacter psychrophilus]